MEPDVLSGTKLVYVTGGVASSLGKGICAAALGRLLTDRGLRVAICKMDPYLNVDPGTMAPSEHGEVFVTDDGGETDLDLGHYERFTGRNATRHRSITAGQVYFEVLSAERRGDLLGRTVQAIPHITGEICRRLDQAAVDPDGRPVDVLIAEIGGTVGDIEVGVFLEAMRQRRQEWPGRVANVHLTWVPEVGPGRELKTKPSQHSVATLRSFGFSPDVLVPRSHDPLSDALLDKLSRSCGVDVVVGAPDVASIYAVPENLAASGLDTAVCDVLGLACGDRDSTGWAAAADALAHPDPAAPTVRVAVVAKYTDGHDTYLSVAEALDHAAAHLGCRVRVDWVDAAALDGGDLSVLDTADGVLVPGGFGGRGTEGKIAAAGFARRAGVPYLGICLGLQAAVVEFARSVAGIDAATSLEWGGAGPQVITLMRSQDDAADRGGTLRVGAHDAHLASGTRLAAAYGVPDGGVVSERHRHRYEVNPAFVAQLEEAGLVVAGRSPDGRLVEHVELAEHPCFIATQAHPEFKTRPGEPHPMFVMFVAAALQRATGPGVDVAAPSHERLSAEFADTARRMGVPLAGGVTPET